MRALVRDDFKCRAHELGVCEEPCQETRVRFLQVHHIIERQYGGDHSLDNLITVCREHHADIHPHMRFEESCKQPEFELNMREL